MHRVLNDIQFKIQNAMKDYMPEVSSDTLEEGGRVYYMNGKNGTEYDWFVNDHLPSFMVFYNDEKNLGAAKATVYIDGGIAIYLYNENGEHLAKEVQTFLDIEEADLLKLAVCLRCNADDKKMWDAAIDRIESDILPDEIAEAEFLDNRKYYEPSIRRKEIMGKLCIVSKKVTREGWKVGFMLREEIHDDEDSGWQFFAGDEDDEYINDVENVELCRVYSIAGIDPAVINHIDSSVGTRLIRKSSEEFEDDKNQPAFMEKWK
ncbi:MAG: DUF2185 domain-containing protein [Lachnospiraceae bacterium]|nr:DUF2185 domain-containing protein [Lachnospiraceae bacterium]